MNYILSELVRFKSSYLVAPVLVAALLSAVIGYYKTKFEHFGSRRFGRVGRELLQWVIALCFALIIILALFILWLVITNLIQHAGLPNPVD